MTSEGEREREVSGEFPREKQRPQRSVAEMKSVTNSELGLALRVHLSAVNPVTESTGESAGRGIGNFQVLSLSLISSSSNLLLHFRPILREIRPV